MLIHLLFPTLFLIPLHSFLQTPLCFIHSLYLHHHSFSPSILSFTSFLLLYSTHANSLSSVYLIIYIFPSLLIRHVLLSIYIVPHTSPLLYISPLSPLVPPLNVLFSSRSWAFPSWHQFVGCHDNLLSQVIYSSRSAWLPHNTGCVWTHVFFVVVILYICAWVWTFLSEKQLSLIIQISVEQYA